MHNFLQTLSFILPVIVVCYVFIILIVNLYIKIRRQFSVQANCWFCNSWFKVPYDNRNSFYCPQCEQYNGFTDDGDYNKIIPEQHDELLNKSRRLTNKRPNTNGLCNICNNNQVLKVVQLARFVPMVEENYDAEIEHFQTQLEKAYKLCKKCEKVLKNTLDKQNANIFGKHLKDIQNKSLTFLKQTNIGKIANLWWRIYRLLGVLAACLVLLQIALMNDSIYKAIIHNYKNNYVLILRDLVKSSRIIRIATIKMETRILLYYFGLFLQLIATIKWKSFVQINRQLCWFVLILSSLTKLEGYAVYLELPVVGYLLLTSFIHESKPIKMITKSKKIRRKQQDRFYSDCSDDDEIEDVSLASTKSTSSDFIGSNTQKSTCEPLINSELNKSLNNLHLGGGLPTIKPNDRLFSQTQTLQRPKPVLSPPKLTNIDNHLLDNNFWRYPPCFLSTTTQLPQQQQQQSPYPQQQQQQQQRTNLSRSSSESSGIGSQNNEYYNYQYLNKTNLFGDHMERASVISEPAYYFKPLNSCYPPPSRPFLRQEGAIFFPNLQPNNLLWIHGNFARVTTPNFGLNQEKSNWSERFCNNTNNGESLQNFRDLSLRSEPSRLFKINSNSI